MPTSKISLVIFVMMFAMGLLLFTAGLLFTVDLAYAQEPSGDNEQAACQELVTAIVANLDDSCGSLARNTACYGNNRVDATFWEAREELLFSAPADRIPLVDLASIATAPLDVAAEQWGIATIHAQADLPDIFPGQAVTFMLMGDASLENRVAPEDVVDPSVALLATTSSPVNLRSSPSTYANIPRSIPAGTPLTLIGTVEDGAWLQVWDDTLGKLWIYSALVTVDDPAQLATLPVTSADATRYGPMQVFYFTTGLGAPACQKAPNALVVQNPTLTDITLNINDLDVTIGSTVVFTMADLPENSGRVLVMALAEGQLTTAINGTPVSLTGTGATLALTVNDEGLVGAGTEIITLSDPVAQTTIAQTIAYAAQNAEAAGIFAEDVLPEALTGESVSFFVPLPPPTPALILPPDVGSSDLPVPPLVEDVVNDALPALITPLGEWGGCGSCDSCGFYADQCMIAPDGSCIWNPGRCQAGQTLDAVNSAAGALEGIDESILSGLIDEVNEDDVMDVVDDVLDNIDVPDLPGF